NKVSVHALMRSYPGISRVITSPIAVQNTNIGTVEQTFGIWDTGATGSAITKSLAQKLGLIPIDQIRVKGVHGYKDGINVYAVKIVLNNQNVSFVLPVTECEQLTDDDSCKFLIGMDVISRGDFAITNFQGQTVMTFRVPSIQRMDFVAGIKSHTPIVADKIPGRNDPCHCGSGKKFKNCHGKS
ncbi:MAG: SEC-C metal-binding domain-containing protein, partial [Bacteroidota bacterium]